jgi:acetolactate synthase-1/2/3 large subunit
MKYSDHFVNLLVNNGYTTVFYVAGGNIMHLLDSCRSRLECIPVIHEVSAVIAAEYFNESSEKKAFALVTAGPGLTNCVTGIAGAWLEGREVLVVGGQVKSLDLMQQTGVRQNGIQEINGVELVKSICKASIRVDSIIPDEDFHGYLRMMREGRPGPVFLEFCLDIQGSEISTPVDILESKVEVLNSSVLDHFPHQEFLELLDSSTRPLILLGGGVSRESAKRFLPALEKLNIPIMTTWNGADRIDSQHPLYFGRPNTWGQRSANIILQQADLLISLGSRLGLQQTGFNWQEFVPLGKVIQVDIDTSELKKSHPHVDLSINAHVDQVLEFLVHVDRPSDLKSLEWLDFARQVRTLCPLSEDQNTQHDGYINPYEFVLKLSDVAPSNALVIPCSSGGAFTTMMQAFNQKMGQTMITNKGLASMGYGLAGAIGASIANRDRTVFLVEGDGGFAQNLQELGTAKASKSKVKIFIYSNEGYASIRMTQKNYFGGAYMGCDTLTGLGLPNWGEIFKAYDIPCEKLTLSDMQKDSFKDQIQDESCRAFILSIHPDQSYFPKITSSVNIDGQMTSDPLHLMTPPLEESIQKLVFRYTATTNDKE